VHILCLRVSLFGSCEQDLGEFWKGLAFIQYSCCLVGSADFRGHEGIGGQASFRLAVRMKFGMFRGDETGTSFISELR
jgi:hypothetical protein